MFQIVCHFPEPGKSVPGSCLMTQDRLPEPLHTGTCPLRLFSRLFPGIPRSRCGGHIGRYTLQDAPDLPRAGRQLRKAVIQVIGKLFHLVRWQHKALLFIHAGVTAHIIVKLRLQILRSLRQSPQHHLMRLRHICLGRRHKGTADSSII